MTLKQALWEIVRDENIIITNQNIDWLLDRALKKASGDAQALKDSILERKGVIEDNIPPTLTNEEKVSEKEEQLEEMASIIYRCCNGVNFDDVSDAVVAIQNAGYRKQSENAIELPCKIGDEVYCIIAKGGLSAGLIFTGHIIKRKVDKLIYDGSRWEMMSNRVYPDFKDGNGLIYAYFGDLAFVNEEEAKARLEEILEVGRKH